MPQELSDTEVFGNPSELSDADVFGAPKELTDADVFSPPNRLMADQEKSSLLDVGKRQLDQRVLSKEMTAHEADLLYTLAQEGDGNALKVLWNVANTPILNAQPPEDQVTEAQAGSSLDKSAMGARQGIDKFLSSFTSPLGIATLGLGSQAPAIQRAASGLFGVQMGHDAAVTIPRELGAEMGKNEGDRDVRKISELLASEAANVPMTAAIGSHALRGEPKAIQPQKTDVQLLTEAINEALQSGEMTGTPKGEPLKAPIEEVLPKSQLDALDFIKSKLEDVKKFSPEENHVAKSRTMVPETPKQELTDEQAGIVEAPKTSELNKSGDVSTTPAPMISPTSSLEKPVSWVIRNKETGEPVMETFSKSTADKINTDKYEAVPSLQHLQELNSPETKANAYARGIKQPPAKVPPIEGKRAVEPVNEPDTPLAPAPENVAPSGASSEDFEINPQKVAKYRSAAMKKGKRVFEGKSGENHAMIAERLGFPDDLVPGFVTKDGEFHYQYEEDAPKTTNPDTKQAVPSEPAKEPLSDRSQYDLLQSQIAELSKADPFDPRIQELWKQSEGLKNKNGGMPPEQKPLPNDTQPLPNVQQQTKKAELPSLEEYKEEPQGGASVPSSDKGPEIIGMGGAIPAEFENSAKTATSIKNAQVEKERSSRGLPPAIEPAKRSFGKVWDEAMSIIDRDPSRQDTLISELRDNPRALTDTEDALLLHRQIDLQNEYGKSTRDLAQAYDDGRLDQVEDLKQHVARLSDQLLDLYTVGKQVGTETGRGLNARKMMAYEDFTLAALEAQKRAAKGGAPLTDGERAELKKIADDYKQKSEALEKHLSESGDRISKLEAQREIDRIARESLPSGEVFKIAEKIVSGLDKRADAARERLKARGTRFSAGIDPTVLLDLAEIGASHIGHLGLDFAKWSAKMVAEFGEGLKPHLEEVWAASQKTLDKLDAPAPAKKRIKDGKPEEERKELSESIKEQVKSGDRKNITGDVQKLARSLVESGIKDREKLIDEVHKVLKEADPEMTRRQAMDAISGYGEFHQLSKDEISIQLRDLKGQMQQIGKLEDMQGGEAPKKTGVERRQPSDEERRLIKQVEEAKRRGGYRVTDPETQLKTSFQATKTRLENQIKDLEHEILTKTRIVREKSQAPTSPEIESLKAKRDTLKAERDEVLGDERDAAQRSLRAFKTRTANRIAELQEKLSKGDYSTNKRTPTPLDEEAIRLKGSLERVRLDYQRGLMKDRLSKRTLSEKVQDTFVKWRRAFLLSSPVTLAKLSSAAMERMVFSTAEEAIGGGMSHVPGLSRVADMAPREGGFSVSAEAKAFTQGFMKGMHDAGQILKTGHSDLDTAFGKPELVPHTLIDFIGAIHGALKAPAKRAEFERSFQKRAEFAIKNGLDPSDPLVQSSIALEAYKDANRAIFMQDNRVVSAYKRALQALEQPNKNTGRTPVGGKLGATVAKTFLPIVRIPTNIVAETMQYAAGLVTGSTRLGFAIKRGIETLKPEEADLIMRDLKKGSLGGAFLMLGYFMPQVFGGYYQQNDKKQEGHPKWGTMQIGGWNIPTALLHNPLLETLQIGATIRHVADSKLRKKDTEKQGIPNGVMAGVLGAVSEVPFVRQSEDIVKMMNPYERQHYWNQVARDMVIPLGVKWIAEHFDKDKNGNMVPRDPHTVLESIESAVPGLRQKVRVKEKK